MFRGAVSRNTLCLCQMKTAFGVLIGICLASAWFGEVKDARWSGVIMILVWSGRIAYVMHQVETITSQDLPKLEKFRMWLESSARQKWWRVAHALDHGGFTDTCRLCKPESPLPSSETSPV